MRPSPIKTTVVVFAASTALFLTGCSTAGAEANPAPSTSTSTFQSTEVAAGKAAKKGSAIKSLRKLKVKGRAPMTGYDRDEFGYSWKDVDNNGCDTRNDILQRDLTNLKFDEDGCIVLSGVLKKDPYTATRIEFVRGASQVDIDHVVALGNAWVTGAFQWDTQKREAVANDPLNLLAVQASANRQKGDGDAATWLPSNKAFRCGYVARQVAVKKKYDLWVTKPERQAMMRVLKTCPGQRLPKAG